MKRAETGINLTKNAGALGSSRERNREIRCSRDEGATAAGTMAAARLHAQGQGKVRVALSIPNEATGPHMPSDFVGGGRQDADLQSQVRGTWSRIRSRCLRGSRDGH